MRAGFVAIALCACGRLGFDVTDTEIDAPSIPDTAVDAASPDSGFAPMGAMPVTPMVAGNSDFFGEAVAISNDGSTLAVGAFGEDSGLAGVPTDESAMDSGAVYIFVRSNNTWVQQAYLKAANITAGDTFGNQVRLSHDGNVVAVAARAEDGSATGVNGVPDDLRMDSGAAYVFTRSGSTWTQEAYLKASNPDNGDAFGILLNLSSDGKTLAVSATQEDSGSATDQTDNTAPAAGAVYVFARGATGWAQQAYLKAASRDPTDLFGQHVALSTDGNTLAVGVQGEDSAAVGIDGDPSNNSAPDAGAAYVFRRTGSIWAQEAYIKASNTEATDNFGVTLALSADGNTLAVGSLFDDSDATGVNGSEGNNVATTNSGAVFVYTRAGTTWTQQAFVKASNTGNEDRFCSAIALADDGNTLAVGAFREDSSASGIGGDQSNDDVMDAGAVYVFGRSAGVWSQTAYLKASAPIPGDQFGLSVGVSADGRTIIAGNSREGTDDSGTVYVFE